MPQLPEFSRPQRAHPPAGRAGSLPGQQLGGWTQAPPGKGQRQQELRPPPGRGVLQPPRDRGRDRAGSLTGLGRGPETPGGKQGPRGSMGCVPTAAVPVTRPWTPVLRSQPLSPGAGRGLMEAIARGHLEGRLCAEGRGLGFHVTHQLRKQAQRGPVC